VLKYSVEINPNFEEEQKLLKAVGLHQASRGVLAIPRRRLPTATPRPPAQAESRCQHAGVGAIFYHAHYA
jgi:hypothetical protein